MKKPIKSQQGQKTDLPIEKSGIEDVGVENPQEKSQTAQKDIASSTTSTTSTVAVSATQAKETPQAKDWEGITTHIIARSATEKDLGKQLSRLINNANLTSELPDANMIKNLSETLKAFKITSYKNAITPELRRSIDTLDKLLDTATKSGKGIPEKLAKQIREHLNTMWQNEDFVKELTVTVKVKTDDIAIEAALAGVTMPGLAEKIATSAAQITKSDVSPPAAPPEIKVEKAAIADTTVTASAAASAVAAPIAIPHGLPPKEKEEAIASLPKEGAELMGAKSEAKVVSETQAHDASSTGMIEVPVAPQVEEKQAKVETQLAALDTELDQVVNNNLKDFYKSGVFLAKYEQHYLSLGDKIDKANLGFTHQELRNTVDRLKEFVNEVERINGSSTDAHQNALAISRLIKANPRFYTDTMNIMNYSYKLKGAFNEANAGFSDHGVSLAVDQYTTKFAQWLSKYPLHLQRYDEILKKNQELIAGNPKYGSYVESIKQLKENYADIVVTLNTSQKYLDLKPLNETKSRFLRSKESSPSNILNQSYEKVYKQIESYFNGNSSEQKSLVGNIDNLLQLHANALQGGTSPENKEIMLKNIPLLLANLQVFDPTHIDQKIMNDLRNAVRNVLDPKAQFPINFKKDEKMRVRVNALCSSANKAMDDTVRRVQEKSQAQVEAQISAAPVAPPPAAPPAFERAATSAIPKDKEEAHGAPEAGGTAIAAGAGHDTEPVSIASDAAVKTHLPPMPKTVGPPKRATPGSGLFPQFFEAAEGRRTAIKNEAIQSFTEQFPGKPLPSRESGIKLGLIDSFRYGYQVAKKEMTAEKTNIYLETGAPEVNDYLKAGPKTAGGSLLSRDSLRNFGAMIRNGLSTVGFLIGSGAALTVNSVTGGRGDVERAKTDVENRINITQRALENIAHYLDGAMAKSNSGRINFLGADLANRIDTATMANLDSLLKKIFDHLQEDRTQLANNINLPAMAKQYQQGLADLTKAIINKVATAPEDSETAKVLIDIVSHLQKKPQAAAATNQAAVVQEKSSPAPQIQRSMEATATKVAGVAANIPAPPPSLSTPAPATAKALDSLNTREKPKAASTASATPSTAATQSNIDVTFTVLLSQRTKVREIIKNQTNPDVRPWPPQAKKEGDAAKATATFSYRVSQMADVASELAKLDPRPKMSPDCNSKFKDAFKKAALEQDISEAKNVQTPRKG